MFELTFTIIVLTVMTALLIMDVYKASVIMFGALLAFYFAGILDIEEALSGFSNQGMLAIGVLFIVARALQSSSGFTQFVELSLKSNNSRFLYLKFMVPVSLLSAFINNIPITAAFIPVLKRWSKKNNFPASKILIPLSYAAILGGMCTLIGTSTNLIVHGLLLEEGMPGFSFFETGKIGLPVLIIVFVYMALVGHRLLPNRKENLISFNESSREFVVELKIEKTYPYIGKTIDDAKLRHLRGLFLFQIIRNGEELVSLGPNEKLYLNDRLFFTGIPETILDLVKTPGLHLMKDHEFDLQNIDSDKYKAYEAVISISSPLIGNTVRDSQFRNKYDAVILAIHRNGHRINKKVGDIVFLPGDTVFILAKKNFGAKWYNSLDFSLVSESFTEYSKPQTKGNLALVLMLFMIIAVATGLIPSLLIAALLTAGIMLISKIISIYDAKSSVDFNVLLVIISALGIAKAVQNSGLAESMANLFLQTTESLGTYGIVAGIFLITCLYTEIITNNAAAAILFPVALSVAHLSGIDVRALVLTVTIAASTSFASPIGYQTNLMVYSPGGYKFVDFLKAGVPINILVAIVTTFLIHFIFAI